MMQYFRSLMAFLAILTTLAFAPQPLQAVTYVTDSGGGGYDETRAATNYAPAVALATVAIAGIIAICVNNSHKHCSSSSSNCHCH